jgi:hypothetical protein
MIELEEPPIFEFYNLKEIKVDEKKPSKKVARDKKEDETNPSTKK